MKILKSCTNCQKEFLFRNAPSDIKKGNGKYCSIKCRNLNMSSVLKSRGIKPKERWVASGEMNGSWKGDRVSYSGLHRWIYRHLGLPKLCEHCGTTEAKKFEWANKSGLYLRDLHDWLRLCVSCHRKYDGHSQKAWLTRRMNATG